MNAAVKITDAEPVESLLEEFRECAADYAWFYRSGWLEKADAVDCAQRHAELWGAVDLYGQDAVQAEMALAFMAVDLRHAPEDAPLQPSPELEQPKRPCTPAPATVAAFWYAVHNESAEYLTRWLEQHPLDAPHLHTIWEKKCLVAAK
jgi:hypothetical protein